MHLMYVDESGDSGYPKPGADFPTAGGPSRRFVRAGVIVHSWKWAAIDQRIADFKKAHGLGWDAEIKATDIRPGRGAFKGWSKGDRIHFLLDLLETIRREMDITIIAVVIDKTKVDTSAPRRFSNPSVRSHELLLERYNQYLAEQKDRTGAVTLDSVEAASDDNLRYFQSYLRQYSDHLDSRRIVEGALFMPSHTTNMLQVADVCANAINRSDANETDRLRERIRLIKYWP